MALELIFSFLNWIWCLKSNPFRQRSTLKHNPAIELFSSSLWSIILDPTKCWPKCWDQLSSQELHSTRVRPKRALLQANCLAQIAALSFISHLAHQLSAIAVSFLTIIVLACDTRYKIANGLSGLCHVELLSTPWKNPVFLVLTSYVLFKKVHKTVVECSYLQQTKPSGLTSLLFLHNLTLHH
jgi:hypothetical protein